ncbi:GntR family transcriptional regulator [Jiangella alba]|uniref:Transcriptional regulator, GntR family n=1 Tax=Jiangella alba TaxID=561176 RepID=A0A1H5PYM0_9ACTN|nr:GntR family transcriptional regulator [Jiangella alba]SEF18107.1 transcriptional regulator, GntR family [Jiangella alba]
MFEVDAIQATDLGERVAAQLRRLIISGSIAPGTRLVEQSLSDMFDVSRGPIRDALKTLQTEGLVDTRRRAIYVIGLDDRRISELYSVRHALESLALREAVARVGAAGWGDFQQPLLEMRASADRTDPESFAVADLEFHSRFYEAADNRLLSTMWNQIRPTFVVLLQITNARDADLHPAAESHAVILERAGEGDADAALRELTVHLDDARQRLIEAHREVLQRAEAAR